MILLSEQTYLQLHCLFAIACDSYKAFKCNEPTHFSVMRIPAGPPCSRHYGDIIRSPYLSLPPPCPQFNTSNSLHRSAPSTPPGICDAHWIIDIKTCPTTTPQKREGEVSRSWKRSSLMSTWCSSVWSRGIQLKPLSDNVSPCVR